MALLDAFVNCPPLGFSTRQDRDGTPLFAAPFDLPTIADARVRGSACTRCLATVAGVRCYAFVILQDIPQHSLLLRAHDNRAAATLPRAAEQAGYVLLQGQAPAHVSVDFPSIDAWLPRFSGKRCYGIRRKLRQRADSISKPGL